MKKYIKSASILLLFFTRLTIGMETPLTTLDDVITFLSQRPFILEKSGLCHSIAKLTDDDQVTLRIYAQEIKTWDLTTNQLLHSEGAPENYVPNTIFNGNLMAEKDDPSGCIVKIYDLITNKCILTVNEESKNNPIMAMTINDTKIVTGLENGEINIREINTGKLLRTINMKCIVNALALYSDDKLIVGANGHIQILDANSGQVLDDLSQEDHPVTIEGVAIHNNNAVAITNNWLKIWDLNTNNLLTTIPKTPYVKGESVLLAINDNYVISTGNNCRPTAWRWSPNLNGNPANNPLLWIMGKATTPQQNLIKRAYEATIAHKKFTIALPDESEKTMGIFSSLSSYLHNSDTEESIDGKLYLLLPLAVRSYLRNRLNLEIY